MVRNVEGINNIVQMKWQLSSQVVVTVAVAIIIIIIVIDVL